MMINIPENHIDQYVEMFGRDVTTQLDILQEECAELIKAISKYKRYVRSYSETVISSKNSIVEEMTHVAISSELVAKLLEFTSDDFQKEIDRKATKHNLNKGENNNYI